MNKYIILFVALLFSASMYSVAKDSVTVFGHAPEYANMHLTFEYQSNYITSEYQELKRFVVDKHGKFKAEFGLLNTTKVHVKLGETTGYLFVEPGKSYEVTLPPYYPLKPENKMNPFL